MSKNLFSYLQRRRKTKLFKQWVEQTDLSPEDIPEDLTRSKKERLYEQSAEETDLPSQEIPREEVPEYTALKDADKGIIRLKIRYFLFGVSLITLLLVILAVFITVIIMRSC